METIAFSLTYALRVLTKRKAFSLVVILTLAIGIGASSSIFSFVNAILLRPLPFPRPDQLVIIESVHGGQKGRIAQREIRDMLEASTSFDDIAGYAPEAQYNLTQRGAPEEVPATICQRNLFSVLGVKFVTGGAWPIEFDSRRAFGIVLTQELWQRKFHADKHIVQGAITLDAYPDYTVFGVVPAGFDFPKGTQLFRSATIHDPQVTDRNARQYIGLGRLRGDATLTQAQQQLDALAAGLARHYPETNSTITYSLMPLQDLYVGPTKPYLLLASVAALLILLIACINVSNLLVSAGAERDKEMAIRSVLGGGARSIISQFLLEGLLLSIAGGVLGVLLSLLVTTQLSDSLAKDLPHWIHIRVDAHVLLFATGISLACGLLAGWLPSRQWSGVNLTRLLKEARGSSGGTHRHRLRKSLVIAELALSVILLIGTLLLLKSFGALRKAELGLDPDNVLTYRVALPWRKYTNQEQRAAFYRSLLPELTKIPGVQEVAFNDNLPLSYHPNEESRDQEFTIGGQSFEAQKANPYIKYQTVSPSYRHLFGIPLLAGRWLTDADDTLSTPVAVISQRMAQQVFKGTTALGQQIKTGKPDSPAPWRTIVGVVGDVRHDDLRRGGENQVYLSLWQASGGNQFVLLKTEGSPMRYAQAASQAVRRVDGDQSVYDLQRMTDRIDQKLWQDKVIGEVFTFFALISVMLASIGIFSVMAYAISLRTKEFGVRRVLGAATGSILGMIFREVLLISATGIGLGTLVSLGLSASLTTVLFDTRSWDPSVYGTVALLVFLVSLLAALLPAWRATRINPVKALKNS